MDNVIVMLTGDGGLGIKERPGLGEHLLYKCLVLSVLGYVYVEI